MPEAGSPRMEKPSEACLRGGPGNSGTLRGAAMARGEGVQDLRGLVPQLVREPAAGRVLHGLPSALHVQDPDDRSESDPRARKGASH